MPPSQGHCHLCEDIVVFLGTLPPSQGPCHLPEDTATIRETLAPSSGPCHLPRDLSTCLMTVIFLGTLPPSRRCYHLLEDTATFPRTLPPSWGHCHLPRNITTFLRTPPPNPRPRAAVLVPLLHRRSRATRPQPRLPTGSQQGPQVGSVPWTAPSTPAQPRRVLSVPQRLGYLWARSPRGPRRRAGGAPRAGG